MTSQITVVALVALVVIMASALLFGFAFVFFKAFSKVQEYVSVFNKMSVYLDRDESRMQLLNDALLKLASEAAASRESVDQIKLLVADAAGGKELNTMDRYNEAFGEFKGQGLDDGDAHRLAAEHVMGGMVGEI